MSDNNQDIKTIRKDTNNVLRWEITEDDDSENK